MSKNSIVNKAVYIEKNLAEEVIKLSKKHYGTISGNFSAMARQLIIDALKLEKYKH